MKRSDMIKTIKSIIATRGSTQPTITTAKQVLDAVEAAGMLPPVVNGPIKVKKVKGKDEYYIKPWYWEDLND